MTAFEEIEIPFHHRWNDQKSHSFLGAAVIDIDGDGAMEVFLGGGHEQDDVLLSYRDGRLHDIIADTGLSARAATYGATAIDIDGDDDTDLFVARADGISLYLNHGGTFKRRAIDANLDPEADPFAVSVADYDGDGDGDLYISVFIAYPSFVGRVYNDPEVVRKDRLLRNDGDLRFTDVTTEATTDVTTEAGVAGPYNTFQATWVDLDLDGDQDLVVAPNTGQVAIFRNDDGRLLRQPSPSKYGFWMCSAVADIDNDGDQDLFFSNSGAIVPQLLLTGDLRADQTFSSDWLLLRNDGDFRFTDVTAEHGLSGFGFAWGANFTDLNLDGYADLVVSQNAEKLPMHRVEALRPTSKAFLNLPAGADRRGFFNIDALGLQRPDYGMAPLFVDLDQSGTLDVIMVNQNQPAHAYLNRSNAKRLEVHIPDTVAALGARVTVETERGPAATQEVLSSVGFLGDHSPTLVFGLGDAERVQAVRVVWPRHLDAPDTVITDAPINGRVTVALP